jgi:hypothetical protein
MSYEVYESDSIQSLFLKLAFIFKQINLDVYLPPTSSETGQLHMPKILSSDNAQVGSIQYGGVKYPITPARRETWRRFFCFGKLYILTVYETPEPSLCFYI